MPSRVIPLDTILPPKKVRDLHRALTAVAKAQAALDAAKLEAQVLCLDAYEATEMKATLRDFDRVAVVFNDVVGSFAAKEQPQRLRDIGKRLLRELPTAFDARTVAAVVEAATTVIAEVRRLRAELRNSPTRRPTITISASQCSVGTKQALFDVLNAVDELTVLLSDLVP